VKRAFCATVCVLGIACASVSSEGTRLGFPHVDASTSPRVQFSGSAASSVCLADHLAGAFTSPSLAAIRGELLPQLEAALDGMDPIDREVLALRHFEELSNGEAAAVLGLDKSAASKRYARALIRLKEILASLPGGLSEV